MATCFRDPVYPEELYAAYLRGQPIADIAKEYDFSLATMAEMIQGQALKAEKRRQERRLEKKAHWRYKVGSWIIGDWSPYGFVE